MTIVEFINSQVDDYKKRDKLVKEEIEKFYNENADAFADGIYKNFILFSPNTNKRFLELYNINKSEWNEFKSKNKVLSNDYQITNDLLKLCFLTTWYNNQDDIRPLVFVLLMFSGAKFSHYFPFRGDDAYVNKMRYTIEYNIPGKSFIKKNGTMYGAMKELAENLLKGAAGEKLKNIGKSDKNLVDMLGRFRTAVNDMIKRLKNGFEKTRDKDVTMFVTKDIEKDGSVLELDNNSTFLNNYKFLLSQYNSNEIEYRLLKLLKLDNNETHVMMRILTNHDDIFHRYAKMYLSYYIKMYFEEDNTLFDKFVSRMLTARLNTKEQDDLDKEVFDLMMKYNLEYKKLKSTEFTLVRKVQITTLVRKYKNYIIIKMKELANKL